MRNRIRVVHQAAQFKEPEDVLKYLKTVKPGHSRETAEKSKLEHLSNKIKCHNCNEDGHKSFKCSKSPSKCTFCGREGHLDLYCRTKQNNNANENKQALETKQGPYRITKLLPNDRLAIEDTPLTRKPGRPLYDAIVAIDKLKPWLVFNKNYDSSENSDDNAIVSQDDD
ncbi:hypothetical protein SFRURICE_012502 [Spodoptera frugiperda]|nr:hypothetical protein SFRURICE_012502 [Spodoptera frugiperda]